MAFSFGSTQLPKLIHNKGMTPAIFAAKLGKSEAFISQVINNKAKFSLITAKNAAHILGVKIEELWEWVDDGDW